MLSGWSYGYRTVSLSTVSKRSLLLASACPQFPKVGGWVPRGSGSSRRAESEKGGSRRFSPPSPGRAGSLHRDCGRSERLLKIAKQKVDP
ncbi:hypothetical protein E2C01_031242 [Portunus trituberculatus]|uniref:Uncharacterized protein n=1 Tax=Portunus trituberculatus TaxID=210409 RepID=A0A5B7ETZ7_PORTR|nr:hypothetical protein [Portunus trituberculatus]